MKYRAYVLPLLLALSVVGCGRFKPPLPPEKFAPKAVEALTVTATDAGVLFAWSSPDEDQQGKELKSIEGYSIQRKVISQKGDETDPSVRFETIGFIKDSHVKVREELRAAARKEGKIGRSIKSPEEHTKFSFVDSKVQRDKTYIYQIVPENQGGTEGGIKQFARVTFRGVTSDIAMIDSTDNSFS